MAYEWDARREDGRFGGIVGGGEVGEEEWEGWEGEEDEEGLDERVAGENGGEVHGNWGFQCIG